MNNINVSTLALPTVKLSATKTRIVIPRHQNGEKFLKGPIPYNWLAEAAKLPGSSLQVAIAIWFLSGLKKSPTVKLSQSVLTDFGVKRHAKYRALGWLSEAGLISLETADGRSPLVTLLAINDEPIT